MKNSDFCDEVERNDTHERFKNHRIWQWQKRSVWLWLTVVNAIGGFTVAVIDVNHFLNFEDGFDRAFKREGCLTAILVNGVGFRPSHVNGQINLDHRIGLKRTFLQYNNGFQCCIGTIGNGQLDVVCLTALHGVFRLEGHGVTIDAHICSSLVVNVILRIRA